MIEFIVAMSDFYKQFNDTPVGHSMKALTQETIDRTPVTIPTSNLSVSVDWSDRFWAQHYLSRVRKTYAGQPIAVSQKIQMEFLAVFFMGAKTEYTFPDLVFETLLSIYHDKAHLFSFCFDGDKTYGAHAVERSIKNWTPTSEVNQKAVDWIVEIAHLVGSEDDHQRQIGNHIMLFLACRLLKFMVKETNNESANLNTKGTIDRISAISGGTLKGEVPKWHPAHLRSFGSAAQAGVLKLKDCLTLIVATQVPMLQTQGMKECDAHFQSGCLQTLFANGMGVLRGCAQVRSMTQKSYMDIKKSYSFKEVRESWDRATRLLIVVDDRATKCYTWPYARIYEQGAFTEQSTVSNKLLSFLLQVLANKGDYLGLMQSVNFKDMVSGWGETAKGLAEKFTLGSVGELTSETPEAKKLLEFTRTPAPHIPVHGTPATKPPHHHSGDI